MGMQKKGYVGEFEFVDNHGAGKIILELNGRLNKCGCISPRYNIQLSDMESWNTRLLPSRQENFGAVVITTSAGIMDLIEALEKKLVVKYSVIFISLKLLTLLSK